MSLPVGLSDEAQDEFDAAFDFYEGRQAGLGVDFVNRVQQVFDRISNNPLMYAVVVGDIRKAVVTRFPYCVYYRPHADHIEVIAVFHTSRDPADWQGRA